MAEHNPQAKAVNLQTVSPRVVEEQSIHQAIYVPAATDRLLEHRKVFGVMPVDYKVLPLDSNGSILILEHTDNHKGGPPCHLHYEQDEWFYVLSGAYMMKIGDENYSLGPGDSVLAPRQTPHVWASVGDDTGRILIVFQPAGKMQEFFSEVTRLKELPPPEELRKLFGAHGMELLGPPLSVE